MIDKLTSILGRIFFFVAFVMVCIAILDKLLRFSGWSISGMPYEPGRIFEFAAIMVTFVIALLLRQIREQLKSKS